MPDQSAENISQLRFSVLIFQVIYFFGRSVLLRVNKARIIISNWHLSTLLEIEARPSCTRASEHRQVR